MADAPTRVEHRRLRGVRALVSMLVINPGAVWGEEGWVHLIRMVVWSG